ncbi:MAG: Cyanate transporter [Ramlibacter sp.]|nr:Cyanate transporter [Ramlibacter sp.]
MHKSPHHPSTPHPRPQHDGVRHGNPDWFSRLIHHPAWAVAAVLLVAFNLRPALTSVAPFLSLIRHDLALSGLGVSLLTTVPVICLGLFGPFAPMLARRYGTDAVILASLLALALGIVIRNGGLAPLFAGTLLIGAAMSLLGVLSPVIVKRDFPRHIGLMMGLYTMLISLGAALSTATAAPLRRISDGSWQLALLHWAFSAVIAAVVLVPRLFHHRATAAGKRAPARIAGLMRDPIAWQVTGFLALVGSLAYAVFSWGPSMLEARGLSATQAGAVISLSYIAQMATGLTIPMIAGRLRDQRLVAVVLVLLTGTGLLGIIFGPVGFLTLFSVVLGLGQGGAFGLALLLIVLRAGNPQVATQLSSMAQSIGYVVSALVGPFAVGMIHDWAGSWETVAVFFVAVGLATLLLGLGAGRGKTVATSGS